MAKLDNPAGRLHNLLREYKRLASPQITIITRWQQVFDDKNPEFALMEMGAAAGLVAQIEASLRRVGDEDQLEMFGSFQDAWLLAVMSPRHDIYGSQSQAANCPPEALAALGGISSYLSLTASEGKVPEYDELLDLQDHAQRLIGAILDDPDLPEELRRLLLDHAQRLSHALDHFRIGGPGAVVEATERLQAAVKRVPEEQKETGLWERAWVFSTRVYNAVVVGAPKLQLAIEAGQKIAGELPPGSGS